MDNTPNFPPLDPEGENPRNDFGRIPNPAGRGMHSPLPPPLLYEIEPIDNAVPDPDNPRWGTLAGVGVWIASIVTSLFASAIFGALWLFIEYSRGQKMPVTEEDVKQLQVNPSFMFYQVLSIILAHILTLAVCWAVATGMGKRPFGKAIGWDWNLSLPNKIGLVIGVVVLAFATVITLERIIPESRTTPFAELLKLSSSIRYVVAFMAVFTAPIVEELVYRCLLYSPLKRALGTVGAVAIVTLLFALVHVPQYLGAWGGLTGLLLLSLALTVVRAKTKSLFPSFAIHALFNSISAVGIVLSGGG